MIIDTIRQQFIELNKNTPNGEMLEIIGSSFICDEDKIFKEVNQKYVEAEHKWYLSQSLDVRDLENHYGKPIKIWNNISSTDNKINSNYGHLFFSEENGSQFDNVVSKLKQDRQSRQAVAIYTRGSIHNEWNTDGMSDFICTNSVSYLVREDKLNVVVNMRSSDAINGFRNDLQWAKYCQELVTDEIDAEIGDIHWCAASLHIYPNNRDEIK